VSLRWPPSINVEEKINVEVDILKKKMQGKKLLTVHFTIFRNL